MVEITINIKADTYIVKNAKVTGHSSGVYLEKKLIGVDVLCLPLVDPNMLIVNELDDGFLINCCAYEMVRKTVKAKKGNDGIRSGILVLPIDYLGDSIVIIPLE